MKTIGSYFKESRRQKKLTLADLENQTKIKKGFLKSIEVLEWSKLPHYPVLLGFVKNIAKTLELDENKAVALFRRDYPPTKLQISPNPDPKKEFSWSPRLTFIVAILMFCLVILGYLGIQYASFVRPPKLEINQPQENQIIDNRSFEVVGKTDPNSTVTVNNQQVLLSENGEFRNIIEVSETTTEIVVVSRSRSGKETIINRKIRTDL